MSGYRVYARRLADRVELDLGAPRELELISGLDSPAVSLSATLPRAAGPGKLGEIRVEYKGGPVFSGRLDKQTFAADGGGRLLRLEARTGGALLLDNEALPQAYANVDLATVFRRHIAPYGFTLNASEAVARLGVFTVYKNTCEWDVLCNFLSQAHGTAPCVDGERVLLRRPVLAPVLAISNTGEGVPFSKLEAAFIPYQIVSRVVVRDGLGGYSTAVANPAAAYYGVTRKRYLVPSSEHAQGGAADANRVIRSSMQDMEAYTVTLPGIVEAPPGRQVRIADKYIAADNLVVNRCRHHVGADGYTTRLDLVGLA